MPTGTQEVAPTESRTERAGVTLTKTEKDSLRLVSTVDETDESTLLRDFTLADILERAAEIRCRLKDVEPAVAGAES